jgi:hypothetical protein
MNQEELKYFSNEKMQEFFREKMGEWEVGDMFGDDRGGIYQIISLYNHSLIPEVNVLVIPKGCWSNHQPLEGAYFIPLPIDPVNPERGLLGMVGERFCDLKPSPIIGIGYNITILNNGRMITFSADTPTLALLRAIASQIGVVR